jgi:trk system potassium uptake protein TrkA
VHAPLPDLPLESHDELLFVAAPEREEQLEELLSPHGAA